jgi:hypothetical protein
MHLRSNTMFLKYIARLYFHVSSCTCQCAIDAVALDFRCHQVTGSSNCCDAWLHIDCDSLEVLQWNNSRLPSMLHPATAETAAVQLRFKASCT